uniref:LRRCT domain-containing protein n=1 Tax=Poecilia reticulata TaxID=8081 RepID=A0A3P9PUD8_POERE
MALLSNFILRLFCLLLHINLSLTYSLKNCSILYEDSPSAGVSVDCANRDLVSVPDDIPKEAVSIELRGNSIHKITEDFRGMTRLRYLGLRKSGITSVDDGCFNDLVSLETLVMRNNDLSALTANMFQGLSNLTTLDLSSSGIYFIHRSAFRFLTSLKVLNLDYNALKTTADIQPIFQLPQIQTLSLRCNELSSFESKNVLLNKSSSLQQLFISGDSLRKFSITTPIFPHLQVVELSTCLTPTKLKWYISDKTLLENITQFYVDEDAFSLKGVQNVMQNLISLRHFKINTVVSWIKRGLLSAVCKIQSLRRLDLFHNKINNMTLKLAPCSQLTELYLQQTNLDELTNVSYDIRSLAFLKILHLDNNFISKLSCEDFKNTTRLVELNLNTNQIPSLERCFAFKNSYPNKHGGLSDLKLLKSLTEAPDVDTFQFNPHLRSLTLTNTDMSNLKPELFRPIPNLQRLDLTNSMLRSMGFLLQANLSALKYLKLTDNKIIMINESVWEALPSLTYLDLSYNLFTCDCSNAGFIQWVKTNKQTQVVDAPQYKCSFPVSKEGTLLLDFHTQSFIQNYFHPDLSVNYKNIFFFITISFS